MIQRLRGGCHLSQVEEDGNQRCGINVDLLSEVSKRGTLANADLLSVAARNRHAANDGCVLLFKLLTLRALRLTSARALAATATERARRCAAAATATTARRSETATGICSGSALTAAVTATGTGTAASATTRTIRRRCGTIRASEIRLSGHHSRVRTRTATCWCATSLRTRATGPPALCACRTRGTFATLSTAASGTCSPAATLATTGTRHALAGCVGVVSGARTAGTRCSGARRTRLRCCAACGTGCTRRARLGSCTRLGGSGVSITCRASTRLGRASFLRAFGCFALRSLSLRCARRRLARGGLGGLGSGDFVLH